MFEQRLGRVLRYGYVLPDHVKGVIIFFTGLNDIAEKYFETVHWAIAQGYGVFILDWYGQGGSGRYLDNPHKRHGDAFDNDVDDAKQWIEDVVKPISDGLPMFLLGHSMGGNLVMRLLMRREHKFAGAILTAPMFGIKALRYIPKIIVRAAHRFFSTAYVVGGADWMEIQHLPPKMSILTKDEMRCDVEKQWMKHNDTLRIGGITYGWLYQAWQSCRRIDAFDFSGFQTPCLIFTVQHEHLVDNRAIHRIARRIPHTTVRTLKDSYHEPLLERDAIRDILLEEMDEFMNNLMPKSD